MAKGNSSVTSGESESMSEEAISDFLGKKLALEEHTKKVQNRVNALQDTSRLLAPYGDETMRETLPWQWTVISGVAGFPNQLLQLHRTVTSEDLPTIQELGDLLAEWHKRDAAYRDAWSKLIPTEQRDLEKLKPKAEDIPYQYRR